MRWTLVSSPVDELLIAADGQGLCTVGFHAGAGRDPSPGERVEVDDDPVLRATADELAAYFAGRLSEFTVPLSVRRGSRFERAVWAELAEIPYGQTRTYGQVAAAANAADTAAANAADTAAADTADTAAAAVDGRGDPGFGAARAVGVACNHNPLAIVVPCHRVIGAGRKLVGFGGGLDRKRFLLELEARVELERALR